MENVTAFNVSVEPEVANSAGFVEAVDGFNAGFEAGLQQFDKLIYVLFLSLLFNVVGSRLRKILPEGSRGHRLAVLCEEMSFSAAFTLAGFLVLQTFLPYLRVT